MPVTRHGRQQRKRGGVATKPEARRIAANIAKLPDLLKRPHWINLTRKLDFRFGTRKEGSREADQGKVES